MEQWLLILSFALIASVVAAIAGTGGGIILLPVLVAIFGVRDAVPMYAVAQLVGNLSRVGFNRRFIQFRVVFWFAIGAVPFSILGAWLFTKLPDTGLLRILGGFLICSVIWRHWRGRPVTGFGVHWFAPIGSMFSLISAISGSAGPFLAPFYLSYGLIKGAFIGSEALGTAVVHVVKLVSYQSLGAISSSTWVCGLSIAPAMILGSFVGKSILERLSIQTFMRIIEAVITGFGLWFLIK
ncbi:MAG: permease [Planctomycetes bacterium RBG_16_41_13]|nr:MAG: permease [Planctomycetes bacterium RBG_16_41_13]